MPPIVGALLLICAYLTSATLLAANIHPAGFFDLNLACSVVGLSSPECQIRAVHVGLISAGAVAASLIIAMVFLKRGRPASPALSLGTQPFIWALLSVSWIISLVHVVSPLQSDLMISRVDDIREGRAMIGFANLIWPILLQLVYSEKSWRIRVVNFAFLINATSLLPYRAPLVSVMYFGVAVPIFEWFVAILRSGRVGGAFMYRLLLVFTIISGVLIGVVYAQTHQRGQTIDALTSHRQNSFVGQIASRVVSPLYQSVVAERMESARQLPEALQTMFRKFNKALDLNLNETIYRVMYAGSGTGQATTMYYGEAIANSVTSPFFWTFSGLLAFVLLYLCCERAGLPVGVLVAVAMWRASMGGVFDVLAGLLIQISFFASLYWSYPLFKKIRYRAGLT